MRNRTRGERNDSGEKMRERHRVDKFIGPTTPWHKHRPQNTNAHPCSGRKKTIGGKKHKFYVL